MKFRTKIWMLPLSAAAVFIVGIALSFGSAQRTTAAMDQLRVVDGPALDQLELIDRGVEQFRLTLQTAAAEGDADRLKEVQGVVAGTQQVIDTLGKLDGKSDLGKELLGAFDAYQSAALGATRAMLENKDLGDQVQRMQAAQGQLTQLLTQRTEEARTLTASLAAAAAVGVRWSTWIILGTGLVVLCVLGVASRIIVNSVWRDLGDEPTTLLQVTRRIAEGNLQISGASVLADDGSLRAGLDGMTRQLRDMVGTIRQATESIASASSEIASGNQDLSSRTEVTASNLQATAASVEQLTTSVRQSADAAQQADRMAHEAADAATQGGGLVGQVVANMSEINEASRRISEIIGVIDGIAFQTNILALNAAVEAARAGEQGRGFAVVAGEVRTLAQRSAQAAREIKGLIGASSEKVESGSRLVRDAGEAMQKIVGGVGHVSSIIREISAASSEQRGGIGQVNDAVSRLDQMTQQNAALVEQSAAAATSMRDQADRLSAAVSAFRLHGTSTPTAPASAG